MKIKKKNIPRLYIPSELEGEFVNLDAESIHYIRNVLRLNAGRKVNLFNGKGQEKECIIEKLAHKEATLRINKNLIPLKEPGIKITLIQGLPRSGVIDNIIQKSTELGIYDIYPVFTQYSIIKIQADSAKKRLQHWEKISYGACEQSGRHVPVKINNPQKLESCLEKINPKSTKIVLHPSKQSINFSDFLNLKVAPKNILVIIGPEGGLSDIDLQLISKAGFQKISLGPRLLRVETAAISACSLIQNKWGDL
ncbi:MAG: 16S rRNA (uracil(1498)-N(3))-methyltransferase [Gammaproteobacteria bacterium]|nr:16S rRNA (uracil(1498)-N(3))-methyltransferase [Gammaproteobacteria bacterium]|tara:strand:- start:2324 stop:3079 length:756 start_codon:yes stop_codon:yes gene_type:complete